MCFWIWSFILLLINEFDGAGSLLLSLIIHPDVFPYFLFVLDQWGRRKFERMCLDSAICVWGWSDDCGLTFSPKGVHVTVMWLSGRAERSVWKCVCVWIRHVTWASSVIGQQTIKHDRKCMLPYVVREASVVTLHAFVWEIRHVASRPTLHRGQDRNDLLYWYAHNPRFVSIQLGSDASSSQYQWVSWPLIRRSDTIKQF